MNWKKKLLRDFKLYAVTDYKTSGDFSKSQLEAILKNGVDIIQLRSKSLTNLELFQIGKMIRTVTEKHRKLFIVNDHIDLAYAVQADGVHLGQNDLPVSVVRKMFSGIIGRSTHSLKQASDAERDGADYIGFGPIFGTPTKPTYQPIGLKWIPQLKRDIRIPFVCIGGIDETNLSAILQAGAERIAVVRAIFGKPNSGRAVKILKERIESNLCHTH